MNRLSSLSKSAVVTSFVVVLMLVPLIILIFENIDFIAVGAAFQPRLNDHGVRVAYFSWLESHSYEKLGLS
jgi:hypothetical protein